MHADDTFVPLKKQYLMLKTIDHLNMRAKDALEEGIPQVKLETRNYLKK